MKITVKMLIVAVLVLAVAVGFTSCKKEEKAASEENEVIVLDVMGYGDNSNQEGVSWVRIVESFEKENPNIDIDYELLYDEAYHQKVTARLAAGETPDLAYMGADARWGAPWMEAGQQWDHSDYLDPMYDASLIPAHGPNGEIYEIPLGTSNITTVLFMNKALVESLGFSTPETYEDLVAMVPAANAAGLDVITIDGADGWAWGSCLLSSFIARTSGDSNWVAKAVAGDKSFDSPEFIAALEYIEMLVKDGVISEKSVMVDYGANTSNFNNGKALFMIQGQWAAGSIENPEVQEATEYLAWPVMPGEKSSTAGTVAAAPSVGYGVTVSGAKDPAKRDAALKFINYFYREVENTQRLRDGAIVAPILKGYNPPADLPSIVKKKVAFAQSAGNTDVIDSYLTGAPNDRLNAGMQEIVTGQVTPAALAAEVEALARK